MHLPKTFFTSTLGRSWNYQRSDSELRSYVDNLHQRVASVDLEVSL